MMKALLLERLTPIETGPLRPREIEKPRPGAGQVLVRVEACGLCHTDLHIIEGEIPGANLPLIPGHQVVGVVEESGSGVEEPRPGARVGMGWLGSTCGQCEFCRNSQENLCPNALFTGHSFNGGFAEYTLARADFTYPLPAGMPAEQIAPLLCAGIVGYRSLRISGVKPGERLGLWGFGASAHIIIQIAKYWNCVVYVFSRNAEHRALALRLGAAWAGGADTPLSDKLHAGIIFAPAGALVPPALETLLPGGTLVLAGIYMSQIPPLDYRRHLYWEKSLRSVTNSTRPDGRELLQLAAEIGIHTEVEVFPLEQANQALQKLKAGKINGAGVIILR